MWHRSLGLKAMAFLLALALWGWVLVNQQNVGSTRTVPVVPRVTGTVPEGYRITTVEVTPPIVTIAGPEETVAEVALVETTDLALSRQTANTPQWLSLVCPKDTRPLRDARVRVIVRLRRVPQEP
jgi:YbbR domain-containing protein